MSTEAPRCLASGSGDPNVLMTWADYLSAIARQQGWMLVGLFWDRRANGSDDLIDILDALGVDVVLFPTLTHVDSDIARLSRLAEVWTAEPFARWQQAPDGDPEKLTVAVLEPGTQFPTAAHVAEPRQRNELASLTWRRASGSVDDAAEGDISTAENS